MIAIQGRHIQVEENVIGEHGILCAEPFQSILAIFTLFTNEGGVDLTQCFAEHEPVIRVVIDN